MRQIAPAATDKTCFQVCKEKEDRQNTAGWHGVLLVVSQLLRLDLRSRRVDPEKFCNTTISGSHGSPLP